jgi:hypothetical protein
MNRKGQFSIIAALLVALVLVGAVVTTYSAIRYRAVEGGHPQILTVTDEANLAVTEILGFTVGYYGSVLQVTGDQEYARQLAVNYLESGLNNVDAVNPEWGVSINVTDLQLGANWFSNRSYSEGNATVTYDLKGLGITGIHYFASTRLEVQILDADSPNQARLTILQDNGEPLINLGKSNLKFHRYDYNNSTWGLVEAANVISYANGTYIVDLPQGVLGSSYILEVKDTRGLMVLASSYSKLTTTLAWNTTGFRHEFDYVDQANLDAPGTYGTHGNFTAQQYGPDGVCDTLTEQTTGLVDIDNYPSSWNPLNTTAHVSGSLSDLQRDNSIYMQLRSHPTAYSSSYNTIGFDSQNSVALMSQANSMSWTHTTGIGNDKILLVSVDTFAGSTPVSVSSITYDGQPLTLLETDVYNSGGQRVRSCVYYLLNPSWGTKTVTVNFAGSTLAVGGSVTYTNVDQTTPILNSGTNRGSSSSQSMGLSASGSNLKALFGHLGVYRSSGYSVYDGQLTRWQQSSQLYRGYGSEKNVTSGSVSASWSTSNSVSWVAIAVLLRPTHVAAAYACEAEFSGSSNTETWNSITWTIDGAATTNGVNVTYQLFNYRTGKYAVPQDGCLTETLNTTDVTKTQTITSNLTDFRDPSGNWKIKITANKTTSSQFDLNLDLIEYRINQINYALNLEEQWINVNASNVRQVLCIKTGAMDSEPLLVQIWHGNSWLSLMTLTPNYFNNVSIAPYIDSATLKIRFVGSNDTADSASSSWNIDCVYLKDEPDPDFLVKLQESTFTLEVLQNGTMRWLGQNLMLTAETLPVPPISVKAFHVNQTFLNGTNREVPFQIEDWASQYQIPLGLTGNNTVFGNRQMVVFLLDSSVVDFTIWWNASDSAVQTPLAYTNQFFKDQGRTLDNGRLKLQFSQTGFVLTSTAGSVASTSNLMRINSKEDTTDPELSFVIRNGVVRDIVLGEAEFEGGITNCPNTYTNIVVTLPAGVTYYTYQLRVMFIDPAPRTRTVMELCPIRVSTGLGGVEAQTENSTLAGFPVVANGTGEFSNYAGSGWTRHHWSQLITSTGRGTAIMFTDKSNQNLYAFDATAGRVTGTLKVDDASRLIELLPIGLAAVSFNVYDVSWHGAVVTFDNTTPVCSLYDGVTPMGLWLLAEYPPTLTVTAQK